MDKKFLYIATYSFLMVSMLMSAFLNYIDHRYLFQKEVEFKQMNLIVKRLEVDSREQTSVSFVSKKKFVVRIDYTDYLSQYNNEDDNYFISTILPEEKISEIEIVSNHASVKGILSSNREFVVVIQYSLMIYIFIVLFMVLLFMGHVVYYYNMFKK